MGNRLRTTYYTRKVALVEPVCTTIPGTDNLQEYNIVSYTMLGNKRYIKLNDSPWFLDKVMNDEGYTRFELGDEDYPFYYIKDHLGNIRETYVRTSGNKFCAQRMQYYPSGLPWDESQGASEQPFKYGSKEFVEMHGLDEYDSEARWYYPAIMRFTAMDPLCEQTPWQSPYVYAANNPVCNVDWMGLGAWGFGSVYGGYQMTILDQNYNVLFHDDSGGIGVYIYLGEDFDEKTYNKSDLLFVGIELPWVKYVKGKPCLYLSFIPEAGGSGCTSEVPSVNIVIFCGDRPATLTEINSWIQESPLASINDISSAIAQIVANEKIDNLPLKGMRILGTINAIGALVYNGYNLWSGEKILDSSVKIATSILSLTGNIYCLFVALSILDAYGTYLFGEQAVTSFVDWYTNFNNNSYRFVWEGYMGGIP